MRGFCYPVVGICKNGVGNWAEIRVVVCCEGFCCLVTHLWCLREVRPWRMTVSLMVSWLTENEWTCRLFMHFYYQCVVFVFCVEIYCVSRLLFLQMLELRCSRVVCWTLNVVSSDLVDETDMLYLSCCVLVSGWLTQLWETGLNAGKNGVGEI